MELPARYFVWPTWEEGSAPCDLSLPARTELGCVLRQRENDGALFSQPGSRFLTRGLGDVFETRVRDSSGTWRLEYEIDDVAIRIQAFSRVDAPSPQPSSPGRPWYRGDLADFLDLTPAELAMIDIRRELATRLWTARMERDWKQVDLARELGTSQSHISAMGRPTAGVSLDLLVRCLLTIGVTRSEIAAIVEG